MLTTLLEFGFAYGHNEEHKQSQNFIDNSYIAKIREGNSKKVFKGKLVLKESNNKLTTTMTIFFHDSFPSAGMSISFELTNIDKIQKGLTKSKPYNTKLQANFIKFTQESSWHSLQSTKTAQISFIPLEEHTIKPLANKLRIKADGLDYEIIEYTTEGWFDLSSNLFTILNYLVATGACTAPIVQMRNWHKGNSFNNIFVFSTLFFIALGSFKVVIQFPFMINFKILPIFWIFGFYSIYLIFSISKKFTSFHFFCLFQAVCVIGSFFKVKYFPFIILLSILANFMDLIRQHRPFELQLKGFLTGLLYTLPCYFSIFLSFYCTRGIHIKPIDSEDKKIWIILAFGLNLVAFFVGTIWNLFSLGEFLTLNSCLEKFEQKHSPVKENKGLEILDSNMAQESPTENDEELSPFKIKKKKNIN